MIPSLKGKHWLHEPCNQELVAHVASEFSLPIVVAEILVSRGVTDIAGFLHPTIKSAMPSPYSIVDMEVAVNRMVRAICNKEKIGVIGDYDVDGATSCAILHKYLSSVGVHPIVCIPDRFLDGYGPNIRMLEEFIHQEINLCITLDCGTTSMEEAEWAYFNALELIIIDHHIPGDELPKCLALVNPNRHEDSSGLGNLCAAGIVFLFIVAINSALPKHLARDKIELYKMLDLVALGTVCDVMTLVGLNRAYVYAGLNVMAGCTNAGITSLMAIAGVQADRLNARHLGFSIGPRVNAGGRLGRSRLSFELLTSNNATQVDVLANEAHILNEKRGKIEETILLEAIDQANKLQDSKFIMVYSEKWHLGVIGIVASRLADIFNVPVAVIALSNGEGRASCRAVPGTNFGEALLGAKKSGLLIKGGGHAFAAGFTVAEHRMLDLHSFLDNAFREQLECINEGLLAQKKYDVVVEVAALNMQFLDDINMLEPCGNGNAQPRLMLKNVTLKHMAIFKEKHARFVIIQGGHEISGVMFKLGIEEQAYLLANKIVNLVGYLSINQYKERVTLQFLVEDVMTSEVVCA